MYRNSASGVGKLHSATGDTQQLCRLHTCSASHCSIGLHTRENALYSNAHQVRLHDSTAKNIQSLHTTMQRYGFAIHASFPGFPEAAKPEGEAMVVVSTHLGDLQGIRPHRGLKGQTAPHQLLKLHRNLPQGGLRHPANLGGKEEGNSYRIAGNFRKNCEIALE